jgi:hypothetical protein
MLKITVDIFSGRPNPTWMIDDDRSKEIIEQVAKNPEIASKIDSGYDGLGFRGIKIELMGDESVRGVPSKFVIANGLSKNLEDVNLAKTIIDQMLRYEKMSLDLLNLTPVNREIQKIIFGGIESYEKNIDAIRKYIEKRIIQQQSGPIRVTVNDPKCNCQYEESRFNPNFWNADPNVRANNNCYNYGRNWRTDTFAQPGRFSGILLSSANMNCLDVSNAAKKDGLVERCNCLPESEYPRRLVALVIAPGVDYHWYRKQTNGFWGHKPGGTAARNVDNSNVLITNPETCDRGAGTSLDYTNFCGYFYAGKSVKIK